MPLPFSNRISSANSHPELQDSDEEGDQLIPLLNRSQVKARKVWEGFLDFATQGDILGIALGLMRPRLENCIESRVGIAADHSPQRIASSFTALVNNFVNNILMPPMSIIFPLNRNIEEKFAVLKGGPNYSHENKYTTLERAKDDGAVVMAYGSFLNQLVSFFCIGFALYGLAHIFQLFSRDPIIRPTVKCKYCRKRISIKAQRCVNCSSWLDGREDRPLM
ncbi:Anditomin synthesis protein L [Colletotrichum sp. SAR11_59]|nr:Anditomin synthesis protein L [Colletotrichum sp. SAR11_59]